MKPVEEREAKAAENSKLTHYRQPGRRSLYATSDWIFDYSSRARIAEGHSRQ